LSGANWCLTHNNGDVLVVYLREGGSDSIDLSDTNSSYLVEWFDPRNGGGLQLGSIPFVLPKQFQSLGEAPDNPWDDWVVLVRRCIDCTSDRESNAGLIAGLTVAGLFVVAIVLFVAVRQSRQRHSGLSGLQNHSRGQDPPTASSNDSANHNESRTSYRPATTFGQAIALREVQGPHYKDQVAPDVQNSESDFIPNVAAMALSENSGLSLDSDFLPTAAAVALEENTVEAEAEAIPNLFRVDL
jgi:Putative collagen-binding domain of a collagenase